MLWYLDMWYIYIFKTILPSLPSRWPPSSVCLNGLRAISRTDSSRQRGQSMESRCTSCCRSARRSWAPSQLPGRHGRRSFGRFQSCQHRLLQQILELPVHLLQLLPSDRLSVVCGDNMQPQHCLSHQLWQLLVMSFKSLIRGAWVFVCSLLAYGLVL